MPAASASGAQLASCAARSASGSALQCGDCCARSQLKSSTLAHRLSRLARPAAVKASSASCSALEYGAKRTPLHACSAGQTAGGRGGDPGARQRARAWREERGTAR